MKVKKSLVLSVLVLLATLALTTPYASAMYDVGDGPTGGGGGGGGGSVYSDYDKGYSIWIDGIELQKWELWVKIDTDDQTWNLRWKQTGDYPNTYLMYCGYLSYIKTWDDKGFSWSWGPHVYPAHGFSGNVTLDYHNRYTWTHTEVRWVYATTPFTYDYITCRVDIYVGT